MGYYGGYYSGCPAYAYGYPYAGYPYYYRPWYGGFYGSVWYGSGYRGGCYGRGYRGYYGGYHGYHGATRRCTTAAMAATVAAVMAMAVGAGKRQWRAVDAECQRSGAMPGKSNAYGNCRSCPITDINRPCADDRRLVLQRLLIALAKRLVPALAEQLLRGGGHGPAGIVMMFVALGVLRRSR